ncbi:SusC/RagA family TonB-linked outer membrane protein [Coprobacter tertius]|uniref:TonB-dependent receptor n=1 Tax=Coprobacter tertius TaxID=2944915 RepID=A0ABT1MEC9_9BACT|nr:TonB-dependent receptor [Coprobacter tertius]MCP9610983.1 TonB-dependent receptor [Coprobacter tertius]
MKNSRLLFFTLLLSLFAVFQLSAQNAETEIIGKVTDENNESLPGVSILVKGAKTGTATDIDGNFRINAPSGSVLVFSYVGMKKREVKVGDKKIINVKLVPSFVELNEVVAIGYGTMKRKDLTGSVASVNTEELAKAPVANMAEALAGRVAGVMVTQNEGDPNAGISIRVRGGISITQNNEPLYIIDGFPSEAAAFMALNPTDIESIDILKDASSTAIYGARGANGVVVVTTKNGIAGKTLVTYDAYVGFKDVSKHMDMLSTPEFVYLDYERRSASSEGAGESFRRNYGEFADIGANYAHRGVDWQREVFRTAFVQNHKLSVSGGTKDLKYSMSYSHLNDQGIMIESGVKKDNIRAKIDHRINKKARVTGNISFTSMKTEGMGTSEGGGGFGKMTHILTYQPTVGLRATDEEFKTMPDNPWLDDDGNTVQNPAASARAEHNVKELRIFNANAGLSYELVKGLTFKNTTGMLYRTQRNEIFNGSQSVSAKRTSINGSIRNAEVGNFQTANTLTYNLRKRAHKAEFMLGQEYIGTWNRYFQTTVTNFPNDDIGLNDLSLGIAGTSQSNYNDDDKILSFFGRVYYNFKEKYMVTGTLRADGSSKFGPKNHWGIFPSVSAAWRLSEEGFIKDLGAFSDLKLRVGYGTSGINRIGDYGSLSIWSAVVVPNLDGSIPGYVPSQIPNKDLKWEANKTFNVGIDLGFFEQRLTISPEFYINRSSNLLLKSKLPQSSGKEYLYRNIGSTQNMGIDLTISSVNIQTRDFMWRTTLNLSHNKNKILALSGESQYLEESGWGFNQNDYLVAVGRSIGLMYGYKTEGLYQVDDFNYVGGKYVLKEGIPYNPNNQPQPGYWKFKDNGGKVDAKGNPLITEDDKQVIGNANPKFYGGIINTFTYKGFDLSIFLNFSYGNDILNATKLYTTLIGTSNKTSIDAVNSHHRWVTVGSDGKVISDPDVLRRVNSGKTVAQFGDMQNGNKVIHSWGVEDGSFLRINNISLGYTFPKKWMRKIKVGTLRIYVTGNNLFTWTPYTGFDPEVSTRNSTGTTPGVDWGAYPRSRSFVFGLSLGL